MQEKEIVKVGGTKAIPINVRVIAATHVNLEKAILEGKFREDLYYRLNKIPIQIPSLRQRKGDIPAIADRLIQKINQDYGRNIEGSLILLFHIYNHMNGQGMRNLKIFWGELLSL